jgi:hypothetical protein
MLTDLILISFWVLGLFAFAGGIVWLLDQLISFHLAGMERIRKIQEKEREGAR